MGQVALTYDQRQVFPSLLPPRNVRLAVLCVGWLVISQSDWSCLVLDLFSVRVCVFFGRLDRLRPRRYSTFCTCEFKLCNN